MIQLTNEQQWTAFEAEYSDGDNSWDVRRLFDEMRALQSKLAPDSLLDSDSQAAEGIADDLPYRIVEEMGLGLTFRSCACGQLPCARLHPLRTTERRTLYRESKVPESSLARH